MNISSFAKADNFLGNCNIGNEGQYLNTALQLVDEFNFKTAMSKEKLVYCNLSNKTGITFTMIPYNKDFIGNGQYVSYRTGWKYKLYKFYNSRYEKSTIQ